MAVGMGMLLMAARPPRMASFECRIYVARREHWHWTQGPDAKAGRLGVGPSANGTADAGGLLSGHDNRRHDRTSDQGQSRVDGARNRHARWTGGSSLAVQAAVVARAYCPRDECDDAAHRRAHGGVARTESAGE